MASDTLVEYLSREQVDFFHETGYLIVKGVLNASEVQEIKAHFDELVTKGPIPGCFDIPVKGTAADDPLKQFPRLLAPEKVSEVARRYAIHPRVMSIFADLFGEEPLSAGTMYYFKPPGARGQALHQDNYYLRIEPGTCIGAWIAIDTADQENGGMVIVPKTMAIDLQCPHRADSDQFTYGDEVDVPDGLSPLPMDMHPGDVLLFNGNTIHGSYPNRSKDRFRRAFTVHALGVSSQKAGHHLFGNLVDRHGNVHSRERNDKAGPCGTILPDYQP